MKEDLLLTSSDPKFIWWSIFMRRRRRSTCAEQLKPKLLAPKALRFLFGSTGRTTGPTGSEPQPLYPSNGFGLICVIWETDKLLQNIKKITVNFRGLVRSSWPIKWEINFYFLRICWFGFYSGASGVINSWIQSDDEISVLPFTFNLF